MKDVWYEVKLISIKICNIFNTLLYLFVSIKIKNTQKTFNYCSVLLIIFEFHVHVQHPFISIYNMWQVFFLHVPVHALCLKTFWALNHGVTNMFEWFLLWNFSSFTDHYLTGRIRRHQVGSCRTTHSDETARCIHQTQVY